MKRIIDIKDLKIIIENESLERGCELIIAPKGEEEYYMELGTYDIWRLIEALESTLRLNARQERENNEYEIQEMRKRTEIMNRG